MMTYLKKIFSEKNGGVFTYNKNMKRQYFINYDSPSKITKI